jgi:hypothetical protein
MSHSGPWPRPIVASLFGGLLSLFRGVWLTLGSLALFLTSSGAQEDLDRGKTPAQLYASGCATCHKSPQSVAKTNSIFGLESFLSEHYTTSRESAGLLAAYLKGLEKPSMESKRGRAAGALRPNEPFRAGGERVQHGPTAETSQGHTQSVAARPSDNGWPLDSARARPMYG